MRGESVAGISASNWDGKQQERQQEKQASPTQQQTAQAMRTVNINLGGKRTSIHVAGDADVHNVERLLREIANDAERAA